MNKQEILIIHTWGMGDMILLTPVLNAIHTTNPDVIFSFLIFQNIAAIPIQNAPYTRSITFTNWKLKNLLNAILLHRNRKYFAALFSSGVTSWKAGLFLHLIRSVNKIGEYHNFKFPFLSRYVKFIHEQSRTENNYRLFKTLLILPDLEEVLTQNDRWNFLPQFFLKQANHDYADNYLLSNKLDSRQIFGIHPGCMAKNKYRRWPKEFFVELIQLIRNKYHCSIIVIAGPDELEEAEYISRTTSSLLVSNATLDNVAALIARCSFFINTDSGLGHVASCFNIKTLTVFGPGDERQTAPFSSNSHIIRKMLPCAPCVRNKKRSCKIECLTNLTPLMVFDKVKEIL